MSWIHSSLKVGICFLLISSSIMGQQSKNISQNHSSIDLFDEVWQLSRESFFNPPDNPDWGALREKYRPMAEKASSQYQASIIINLMLSELKASHTHLYTRADWEYYDLMDIFKGVFEQRINELFPSGKVAYSNIGIFTKKIHGKIFVNAVLDGGPAFRAGIVPGDEIISVNSKEYHPVWSFKTEQSFIMQIRRSSDPASVEEIRIVPEERSAGERYLDAMKASAKIIEDAGYKIGYIHVWSFTGEQNYLQLLEEIQEGRLKDADGLVLDFREGWGGANPYYLSPFDPRVPTEVPTESMKNKTIDFKWEKPVVILINEKTRSGKESLVYSFKQAKLGKLVGTTTAGAGLPGRPYLLRDGSLLLLAHQQPQGSVVGKAIEGKGVAPDIYVKFPLEYAAGHDPQLEAAIEAATDSIRSSELQ